MRKLVIALAAAAALSAAPAAAAIKYTFTALSSYNGNSGSFVYQADSFISSDIGVSLAQMDSCTSAPWSCSNANFYADFGPHDLITFIGDYSNYYFADGAFSTLGLHNTVEFGEMQAATLLVEDTSATDIPEPAMLGLFGLGALGLGLARRRRA